MKFVSFILTLSFLFISSAQAEPNASIIGKFHRADKKFIYIRKEAGQLVRIPREYSLNSPSRLSKGMKVKFDLPLAEILRANQKSFKKALKKI